MAADRAPSAAREPPTVGDERRRPSVDVVILTWNDGELLRHSVESVHSSTDVDARVIVVDNGSDPPAAPPHRDGDVLMSNSTNRGVAAGRNQGALRGSAPFVCLLDSDAELRPASLRRMLDVLASDDDIALVAPVFEGQAPTSSGGRAPTLSVKLRRLLGRTDEYQAVDPSDGNDPFDVDFAIGACQVFRRQAYEAVGGLDERYFYGPEDVDFCLRLREAGWRILQVPAAPCLHPPRRRHRNVFSVAGVRHALAVGRFLWRHRSFASATST